MLKSDQLFGFEEGELGSVIQLSPHQNTSQVRAVAQPDDGEPLVSLDDVYEVTGQESIGVLVRSCKEFFGRGRLAKESMTCLRLSGFEGFVPLYDKYNARLGGEGFVDKLKKGFVTIITAIIGYIKKVVDWVVVRLKSIFGLSKSEKELAALAKESTELNSKLIALVGSAHSGENGTGALDTLTFIKSLPAYVSSKEAITLVRNKAISGEDTIRRLGDSSKEIEAAENALNSALMEIKAMKSRYDSNMSNIRRMRDEGSLIRGDVNRLENSFGERIDDGIFERMFKVTTALLQKVYDIDISGLGMEPGFRSKMEEFNKQIVREKSPWLAASSGDYSRLEAGLIARVNANMNSDIASKVGDVAKTIGSKQDAIDIQSMSKIKGSEEIFNNSLHFMSAYSLYVDMLETCADQLQNIKATVDTAVKWHASLKAITSAYLMKDAEEIVKWHDENKGIVNPDDSKHLIKNGRPTLLYSPSDLVRVHYSDEKGTVIKQDLLDIARALLTTPDNKRRTNNLLKSLGLQLRV